MSAHRQAPVRPRYGRMVAAGSAFLVTMVAALGGLGVLPSSAETAHQQGAIRQSAADGSPAQQRLKGADARLTPSQNRRDSVEAQPRATAPAGSGHGRRVVFAQGLQRVWLVNDHDRVLRTYLVSGSLSDNLDPGTYDVYSRSMNAYGVDDSGTMRYFVRFTRGHTGAAIGFHDIPVDDGARVQTVDQLGTPQSHGCIRQRTADAKALWRFAPLGTRVVVIA